MDLNIFYKEIRETNDLNQDLANYGKSLAHRCKTNSFTTFNKLQLKREGKMVSSQVYMFLNILIV